MIKCILESVLFSGKENIKWKHTVSHTPGSDEAPCQMDSSWMSPGNSLQLKIVFIVSRLHVYKPTLFHPQPSLWPYILRHMGSWLVNTTRFETSPQGLLSIFFILIACKYLFHLHQRIIFHTWRSDRILW